MCKEMPHYLRKKNILIYNVLNYNPYTYICIYYLVHNKYKMKNYYSRERIIFSSSSSDRLGLFSVYQ